MLWQAQRHRQISVGQPLTFGHTDSSTGTKIPDQGDFHEVFSRIESNPFSYQDGTLEIRIQKSTLWMRLLRPSVMNLFSESHTAPGC